MTKYIHYCWFGGKPLPKLAKKCLKSWEKYLPDYKIIRWDESNVDINECNFIKDAYKKKKWAFVADYARTKAMYDYGGIYFDTDMEVIKNIDDLLKNNESFLGVEDSHMIACGVWYEKNKHSYLATQMLSFYRQQDSFDIDDLYKISIPRVISNILSDYDSSNFETQTLKHNITIYKREYFYPLSYDHQYNVFTDKTCMIHYYDASWTPKWEQRENKIFRIFGKNNGNKIINTTKKTKKFTKKVIKIFAHPMIKYIKKRRLITNEYLKNINETISKIPTSYDINYIAFYNKKWFGVSNATKELFEISVPCEEIYRKKDINKICMKIKKCNYKQVIFSGFCIGWKELAIKLHDNGIIVKTYFHGSHSQALEPYGWKMNMEIYELATKGIITKMATCKESLVNFYKKYNCPICLLSNKVNLTKYKRNRNNDIVRIGLYAAKTDDFRKNAFAQIAAVSKLNIENVEIDMVPLTNNAKKIANLLNIRIIGVEHSLSREELLKRMANCDVISYVTFSECAPMTTLESFTEGVPCIVGNNCHYFKDDKLNDYIVVNQEDSPQKIAEKINYALENKEYIMSLYEKWYKNYLKETEKLFDEFIRDGVSSGK